ncbi:MAG: permease-like cell division protein FtsX [bacterium]|nr:permease-like cell division protein FtsX [bacterium]
MFFRNIRDAFKSVYRNFSLSLASISCITITLVVVAIALMASLNIDHFTKNIRKDVTIVVFAKEEVEKDKIGVLQARIEQLDNVHSVTYRSNDEEKQRIQEAFPELETIFSNWEVNHLLESFLVTVDNLEDIEETANQIASFEEIETVDYGEVWVNKLMSAFEAVEKVTVASVIALIIVTVFLIINTIKLAIFSRKREISIMRLVGASNFTIKMPFVVEGMVLGFIGSIIPIAFTLYGYLALYNHFEGQLFSSLLQLIKPEPFIYVIALIVLLIGMIVGMLGSYRAVKKYLKI